MFLTRKIHNERLRNAFRGFKGEVLSRTYVFGWFSHFKRAELTVKGQPRSNGVNGAHETRCSENCFSPAHAESNEQSADVLRFKKSAQKLPRLLNFFRFLIVLSNKRNLKVKQFDDV